MPVCKECQENFEGHHARKTCDACSNGDTKAKEMGAIAGEDLTPVKPEDIPMGTEEKPYIPQTQAEHDVMLREMREKMLADARDQAQSEFEKEAVAGTLQALINEESEIMAEMDRLGEITNEPEITLIKEFHPHNPKKYKMINTFEEWEEKHYEAKKAHDLLVKKLTKLYKKPLVATLRYTPFEHERRMSGAVNGVEYTLFEGKGKGRKDKVPRGLITFGHWRSLNEDACGEDQCGVYSWRIAEEEEGDVYKKPVNEGYVKTPLVDARPATAADIAASKASVAGKRGRSRRNNG